MLVRQPSLESWVGLMGPSDMGNLFNHKGRGVTSGEERLSEVGM